MIIEPGRHRVARVRIWVTGLLAMMALGLVAREAEAQGNQADFVDKPILVLDTGGHHAPVRRLVFTPDEARLLSSGDDKVVRVWNVEPGRQGLARTIRPRIWRGFAGAINAMALTADARGRQTLALAGFGTEATRGEIGLYNFPGAVDLPQGDIIAYIPSGDRTPRLADSKGHLDTVTCMAFAPKGEILATSSNDQTVRLWDYRNRTQIAVLTHPDQRRVNALAFTPDGKQLATGGSDGTLRIWDVSARPPVLIAQAPPRVKPGRENDPEGLAINALDISPDDGRWVVTGREDGTLFRYDLKAANLDNSAVVLKTGDRQGPVEGLAFGPGNLLATSIIRERATPNARPTVACDIEIRQVLDPNAIPERLAPPTSNLAYALAFSPKGKYLAFAGGDRQEIKVIDLLAPQRPTSELSLKAVQGSSIWQVGFAGDGLVAYSQEKPANAPPEVYWGFDLKDRSRTTFSRDQVQQRAIKEFQGWTVQPLGPLSLRVSQGNQARFDVQLSANLDGRWWDYSFLPPGPNHARPALAVACHRGVVVYRLEDGLRTRFLDGHSGAVYCLAPSSDGKWLATGSSDQTVRLWSLAGCDVLAPLGAEFERRGATLVVKSVERLGFADVAGLQVDDVFDRFGLAGRPVTAEVFQNGYATAPPNTTLQFLGRGKRPGGANGQAVEQDLGLVTTKRDRPLLSLFVGSDREWVLWTSRGYYDASIVGDEKFLGWQINRSTVGNPRPTEYLPILTFEKQLRQRKEAPGNLIGELLRTADETALLGPPRPEPVNVVVDNVPPAITPVFADGGGAPVPASITMAPGPLNIIWRIEPSKGKRPGPFRVHLEGKVIRPAAPPPFDPAVGIATVPMKYDLSTPGTYIFTALAETETGVKREVSITARVEGIPPRKPGRLQILALAPEFAEPIRPISASERDVDDLSAFFPRHLVNESGERFPGPNPPSAVLDGKNATASNVLAALDALGKQSVQEGDVVVLVIETYVLTEAAGSRLVVSDSKGLPPRPDTTIPTETINAALESLAQAGCKVIVVLDGVHELKPGGMKSEVVEWVRTLRNQYKVTTVVATTRRPIHERFLKGENRPLAQAILDSIGTVGIDPKDPLMSLADLRDAVRSGVLKLTGNTAEPEVYIPNGINAGAPILNRK